MIVIDTAKEATVREADLIGTAMSVEFDSTHQDCCCCELLNLEQYCCAIALASPPALMHAVLLPFSTCNIESG